MIANQPTTVTIRVGDMEISISQGRPQALASITSNLGSIWPAELVERVEVDLLRDDEAWERTSRWR